LRILVLGILLLLTGCVMSRHAHTGRDAALAENKESPIVKQNNEAIDQCEKLYPDSHRKPTAPRIKCFNGATLAYYSAFAGTSWSNLVKAFTTRMAAIAGQYDKGQISEPQLDVEKERAVSDFTSQAVRRQSDEAPIKRAPAQSGAAGEELAVTVLPKQMTCVPVENGVSCY
jgi:hypothetical protein